MDIQHIISQMTVEEKASLCSGLNFWETKPVERLGVPSIMMTDGPHGLRKQTDETDHLGMSKSVESTCFPAACATACSFDRELLNEMGIALAKECVAENVAILLGPGVNIKRSPLCGRNFEYFSEDPLLASELASAYINGVQSLGVGTSLKHFALNNQESRRFSSDAVADERTMFEIYLASFENTVKKSRPTTLMCAYNKINGEYCSENKWLLTDVLRDKWGFEGFVVSDWGAVNERVKGLDAGLELEMPSTNGVRDREIVEAVKSGELSEAVLDQAVERILKVIERVTAEKDVKPYDKQKHHALARRIASESAVLLKNNGALPLEKGANIAFIGEFAENPRYQGAGSSQVNPTILTTPLEAAREFCNISYSKGFEINNCDTANTELVSQALALAKEADICVIFAGLPPAYESEGYDREHMRLPQAQNELISEISKVCKNTVIVLQNGSPIEMPWVDEVNAILEGYLGGQAGGGAIADLLFGEVNPCGKLAETFPKTLSDNPSHLYFQGERDRAEYREGVFVGYRYYDTKYTDVLFPFGHGVSYTSFEYSNLCLDADEINDDGTLTVSVDIKNIGSRDGKEIVQLYVSKKDKDDLIIRPIHELKAFDKIFLAAGETKTVTFKLDKDAFAYYNTEIHGKHVISGEYVIQIAHSSRDIAIEKTVKVNSTVDIKMSATINTPIKDIMRMKGGKEFIDKIMSELPAIPGTGGGEPGSLDAMFAKMLPEMPIRSLMMFAPDMVAQAKTMIEALNKKQL